MNQITAIEKIAAFEAALFEVSSEAEQAAISMIAKLSSEQRRKLRH